MSIPPELPEDRTASGAPASADSGGTARGSGAVSLGFVVTHARPEDASEFCGSVVRSVPRGIHIEFLVLDDHTNPQRRGLVAAVDSYGDSVRLVPRPAPGVVAELDAATLSSCSEYTVITSGVSPPWEMMAAALIELRSDGSDFVVVSRSPGQRGNIAAHLGIGQDVQPDAPPARGGQEGRIVVLRRWAARWMFSEVGREEDPAREVIDRARLLGLRVLEMHPERPTDRQ